MIDVVYKTKLEINQALKERYPWGHETIWKKRSKTFGAILTGLSKGELASIIDLGGGMGHLYHEIKLKSFEYISIDTEEWTSATVKANFNKDEFPDITPKFQSIIACQGLVEYMERPKKFLKEIHKYGDPLVISYRVGTPHPNRKNFYTFKEFEGRLIKAGWLCVAEWTIGYKKKEALEKIYLCVDLGRKDIYVRYNENKN